MTTNDDELGFFISECPECGEQWLKAALGERHECDPSKRQQYQLALVEQPSKRLVRLL